MKQNFKLNKGFTLVEMTIVIFIVGMIATLSIANYRAAEKRKRIVIAADVITNAIRNAQNFALTSRQIPGSACATKSPSAYVIKFTAGQTVELYGIDKIPCTGSTLIETYPLPLNTRIQSNGYKINTVPVSTLQMKFTTPFAQMTSSSNSTTNGGTFSSFTTATITVEASDASIAKTITIDGVSGRIGE